MILFRPEVSAEAGLGHFMRCVALAGALDRLGAETAFLLPASAPTLPGRPRRFTLEHSDGGPLEASETASLLRRLRPGLLITDSYRHRRGYFQALRADAPATPVLAFDDEGLQKAAPVYGYLRFGLAARAESYPTAVRTRSVLGPRFTPLRPEFARRHASPAPKTARRLILTLGGSDPEDQTIRLASALKPVESLRRIDIVLGPLYGPDARLRLALAGDRRFVLHRAPARLAALMAKADLAVCGGGITCAELASLGVPALIVSLAPNQRQVARAAARQGCGVDLGGFRAITDAALRRAVTSLSRDRARRARLSRCGRALIDGGGGARAARAISDIATSYHRDRFHSSAVRREYDRSASRTDEYDKVRWGSEAGMENRFKLINRSTDWKTVHRWLDVGCGTGAILRHVEQRRRALRFTGLDMSPALLRFARGRSYATKHRRFLRGDLASGVPGGPYDLITCVGVLQKSGLPLAKAVALLAEGLAPGGQILATTKNRDWKKLRRPGFSPEPTHHWFRLAELREAFSLAGLSRLRVTGFEPRSGRFCPPKASHSVLLRAVKPRGRA